MAERTEEQQAFVASVRQFAQRELAPDALRRAHEPGYAWDSAALLARQGLLGLTLPEADGGQGATLMDAVIALQEVSKACPKSGDVLQAGNFGAIRTFAEYASEELKARHLPDLLSGRGVLALGMSEPEAGSAATDLQTTAVREGGKIVVNGTKVFSTNSPDASLFLVYVRFGPGTSGIGSVIIERDTPGLTLGQPSTFMNGEEWCQLYFDNCTVPEGNVVLGEGGFRRQIAAFNVERLGNAARSLALGQLAFDLAREHALTRQQFGKRLCDFQGLQWKFADMAMALDAAQMMLDRAALNAGDGLPDTYEATVAKLAANTAGFQAANESLQIMGATGYSQESLVEYCLRRTRGWMIAGGSIEMLKNRIAESVFDQRFDQRPPKAAR